MEDQDNMGVLYEGIDIGVLCILCIVIMIQKLSLFCESIK